MKKKLLSLIVQSAVAFTSWSQIPNAGFENWTVYGSGFTPNGWWSANDSLSTSSGYFPITRSTDHYPPTVGNYSIRLECNPSASVFWQKPGVIWVGDWEGNNDPSFAISGHPKSLCGYYKYNPQNNDSFRIYWELYKNGSEVSRGFLINSDPAPSWTPFRIFASDTMYSTADSARIMISSFNTDRGLSGIRGNSILYIDNLSFDSLITTPTNGVNEITRQHALFELYPNPVLDLSQLHVRRNTTELLYIDIYDMTGICVQSLTVRQEQQTVNLENMGNGMYWMVARTQRQSETKILVVIR